MIKGCVFRPQSGQNPAVWGLARGGWLGKRTRSAQAAHRVVGAPRRGCCSYLRARAQLRLAGSSCHSCSHFELAARSKSLTL